MKKNDAGNSYAAGPTTCMPKPAVLTSIRQQLKKNRALSRGDVRIATAMGLVAADSLRPYGYNDGAFYPLDDHAALAAAGPSLSPSERVTVGSTKKSLHALALLVDFSDNVGKRPASDFQKLLFDAADPKSMASYYKALSRGQLTVTGQAVGYVRAPRPYSYYTNGQSGTGQTFPQNTPGLLVDALTEFCKTNSLKPFDTDNDGYVDGIFLIHAGGGAEAEADAARRKNMIWSHKWTLPTPFTNSGVKVFAYSTEPEDGRVGVFAHEFGHVLGLPDLYDSSYRSRGIGDWCLMSGGSWGGNGNNPTRMSCWCLSNLGWITPANVKKAGTLTLDTLENDPKACYRVWSNGASGPEYFLLENRQKVGQDSALPGSGLAVWHIDENQSGNSNPPLYKVALVQADGLLDLENNRNAGEAGDLFPGPKKVKSLTNTTTPSTQANNGLATSVSLTGIAEKKGIVTVSVKV